MIFESTYEVRQGLKDAAIVKGDRVEVIDVATPPDARRCLYGARSQTATRAA